MSDPTGPIQLGFLTVFQEGPAYVGGYLVTNSWGRPLEFRLSTAVQPNKVQQVLYGPTLSDYLSGELIGKTLVEKCSTQVHILFTDSLAAATIRRKVSIPVLAVLPGDDTHSAFLNAGEYATLQDKRSSAPLVFDPRHVSEDTIRDLLDRIDTALEIIEPFSRIREAMGEARKLGVTSRAA